MERASKRTWLGQSKKKKIELGDLTQRCTFLAGLPYPPQGSSMILVPREAQIVFSCMLISFSMFLRDSDQTKAKPNTNPYMDFDAR